MKAQWDEEEHCWAITQTAVRSCCGRSGSIVLGVWISLPTRAKLDLRQTFRNLTIALSRGVSVLYSGGTSVRWLSRELSEAGAISEFACAHVYIYIYIYICVCVCLFVCVHYTFSAVRQAGHRMTEVLALPDQTCVNPYTYNQCHCLHWSISCYYITARLPWANPWYFLKRFRYVMFLALKTVVIGQRVNLIILRSYPHLVYLHRHHLEEVHSVGSWTQLESDRFSNLLAGSMGSGRWTARRRSEEFMKGFI
jgi:hypothetical protein